ncbi:MAG: hypothetical protein KY394_06470, partial [Actinobacteria bacterium]|nr:hypothetical protein [Actinomycetota bacterium]
ISWDEIDEIAPDEVGLAAAAARLEAEPWPRPDPIDLSPVAAEVETALEDAGITLEPFDRFRS